MDAPPRPTLLSSCAMAATAAEARFRIDAPEVLRRASRVVALDPPAAAIVRRIAGDGWSGARFHTYGGTVPGPGPAPGGVAGDPPEDAVLHAADGSESLLHDELDGADVVVMIATGDGGSAEAAAVVGRACAARRIMPAGLVVAEGGGAGVDAAVSALRPYAMVLAVLGDAGDVPAMLTALRA